MKKPTVVQSWILYRMASVNWRIYKTQPAWADSESISLHDTRGKPRRILKRVTFEQLQANGWIEPDPKGIDWWRISSAGRTA